MHASIRQLNRRASQGNSLLIAMVVLLAFAVLVLAGSHALLGEQRISANQNDRQFAFQLGELALRDAENETDRLDSDLIVKSKTDAELFGNSGVLFTANCSTDRAGTRWGKIGLCLTADRGSALPVSWGRTQTIGSNTVAILSPCGNSREYQYETNAGQCSSSQKITPGKRVWANPRYIVELISRDAMKGDRSGRLYRITASAWGRNQNTQVTLQSYYFIPIPIDCSFAGCNGAKP